MGHNRKLLLSGAAFTPARPNRYSITVGGEVRDELEAILEGSGFFAHASFKTIAVSLRYGSTFAKEPKFFPGGSQGENLELSIEMDAETLKDASRDELKRLLTLGTLVTLIFVGKKFRLPIEELEARQQSLRV